MIAHLNFFFFTALFVLEDFFGGGIKGQAAPLEQVGVMCLDQEHLSDDNEALITSPLRLFSAGLGIDTMLHQVLSSLLHNRAD